MQTVSITAQVVKQFVNLIAAPFDYYLIKHFFMSFFARAMNNFICRTGRSCVSSQRQGSDF